MIHMSGVALSSNHDAMLITPKEFRGSILNMTPTSRIQTSYAYIIQRRLERGTVHAPVPGRPRHRLGFSYGPP